MARADGTADEADVQFQLGAKDFQRGDFESALAHFLSSNRLAPNHNVVFNIAITFERLQRLDDAYRYYLDALQGETDPSAIALVKKSLASLSSRVAVLDIVTEPPGATLYVDRVELGSAGHSPRAIAVPPGSHRILAQIPGYEPAQSESVTAALGHTEPVRLHLTRIVGTLHIESPHPTEVHVDGELGLPACTTPCDLPLPPGVHQLSFYAEGFQAPPTSVDVIAYQRVGEVVPLKPLVGSLMIRTDEPGALVTVDGHPSGFTPAVIPDVPVGRQEVTASLRGHTPVTEQVDVHANQQAQPPEISLPPVREVVAVSRHEEQVDDAPSSLTIITGDEIRAFGYPTLADALTGVRGFTLSNDAAYASANVRGLGQPEDYGNRLLVLADGQSLNDNIDGSSNIGSNARVDLEDVSRLEIIRGPGSLLYGAGALSGVINIVGRDRDEPDHVEVGGGAYDDSALHGRGDMHYSWGPDRGIWASASGVHSDGLTLDVPVLQPGGGPINTPVSEVDDFRGGNTAGRVWWGPFTAQWFYNQRDEIVPVGAYGTPVGNSGTSLDDSRGMAEVRFEPHLSSTVDLLLRFHVNRYTSVENFASDSGTPSQETYLGTWLGTEARLVWKPVEGLHLTGGAEGQYDPVAAMYGYTVYTGQRDVYLNESHPYGFGAGYLLAEAAPHPRLHIQIGARLDDYTTFGAILVPRATAVVKVREGGTLKLIVGRSFRAPSFYEQFYNDGAVTQAKAEDPSRGLSLGPESYYSAEAELSQRFREDWVALGSVYGGEVDGLISTVPDTPGSSVIRFANSATPVTLYGADVELRREFRRGWMLSASYGYEHPQYTEPVGGSTQLVNAPENQAAVKGVVPLVTDVLSLAARAALEAPRRINLDGPAQTAGAVVIDVVASGHLKAFGLRYNLGIYNLANQVYQAPVTTTFASATLPQMGRTFLFNVMETWP